MSRQLNPSQIWSQLPVASRTVEVNTKTGFSLTAGSYSVRASSTQTGLLSLNGVSSNTLGISSVTKTRSVIGWMGVNCNTAPANQILTYIDFTSAVLLTAYKGDATGNANTAWSVLELF